MRQSAEILVQHLTLLAGAPVVEMEQPEEEEEGIPNRIAEAPIEELELTVRAYNCLKRAGITKIGEILKKMEKGEDEMLAIRNFGKQVAGRAGGSAAREELPERAWRGPERLYG